MRRKSKAGAKPVTVGVICPSIFEYDALKNLTLQSHAAVILSGMGKVRAAWGVQELKRRHPTLRNILLIGFAGGLRGLVMGDLIEPRRVIEQDYCAEPFEKFPNQVLLKGRGLVRGSKSAALLTQDRFLTSNPYRAGGPPGARHSRLACDMEAYAVAWTAQKLGTSCSIVKLISDEADSNADHDFLKACTQLRPRLQSVLTEAIHSLSAPGRR
ncbi:MAG: hypothetical protein KBD07_06320 [Candidatus Omnitrophica bacterium]|jgi:nucleoside phosphorylase|nr:hypothetical protein [Candidatus Omnitrophota bacterium]